MRSIALSPGHNATRWTPRRERGPSRAGRTWKGIETMGILVALSLALAAITGEPLSLAEVEEESRCPRVQTFRLPVRKCRRERVPTVLFIRYVPAIEETRPPLILLHFTSGHSGTLMPLAFDLARRGYPVYAFDLLNHGLTTGNLKSVDDDMLTLQAMTRFVQSRHGPQLIGMAGTSFGGDLSVLYTLWEARREQQRGIPPTVGSVVGQGLITPWQRDVCKHFSRVAQLIYMTEPVPIQLVLPPRVQTDWLFRINELFDSRELRRKFRRDPLRDRAYSTAEMVRIVRYLPELPCGLTDTPVMVLEAGNDRLVPEDYEGLVHRGLSRYLSNCELHEVGGMPHGMFVECPKITAQVLDEWYERTLPMELEVKN